MRKLKLQLENLAVESFSPAPAATGRGTAHAHRAEDLLLPPDDTSVQPGGETQVDCLTCELSCGTRGC